MSTDTTHPTGDEVRTALAVFVQRGLADPLLADAAVVLGAALQRLDGATTERDRHSRGRKWRRRWVGPWMPEKEA